MKIEDTGKALVLKKNESEILQYNYAVTNPPSGVDTVYQRSGFIHLAYAPSGNILTTYSPKIIVIILGSGVLGHVLNMKETYMICGI